MTDPEQRTELHYAALADDEDRVRALLASGANPNAPDRHGFTPLHLAAQGWALKVAEVLLDAGALVDPVNEHGNTPLFVAVFNSKGRGELIQLLRQRGANPYKPNDSGQSPLGLARLIGNYDVARYFADLSGAH